MRCAVSAAFNRLDATLTDREQEIVALKGRACGDVSRKVDEIHRELSGVVSELRSVLPRSPEDDQFRATCCRAARADCWSECGEDRQE